MNRGQIALDVFDYADHRAYLADWLAEARRHDARVSHRWFAHRLGTTDPSALRHVISGRRPIAEERVGLFCRALGLEGEAEAYFRALVAAAQAQSPELAELARGRLAALRARRGTPEPELLGYTVAVPESRLADLRRLWSEVQRLAQAADGDRVVHVTMALAPSARAEPSC